MTSSPSRGPVPPAPPAPPAPPSPLASLHAFERLAYRTMRFWNCGGGNRLALLWQRRAVIPFVGAIVSRRLRVHGLERVTALPPDARILLVANHRTFFDLFVLGYVLWRRGGLTQRLNFPVRANFFYENPLGLAICLFVSGGTMFPPFFRDAAKKPFNRHSLDVLIEKLRTPGQLVGFHPEGTRSKSDDPYTLLPAQPGAGELALKARPVVVPAFITGLSNSLGGELRSHRPIVAVFGDPVPLPEVSGETRLSHHKRTADLLNEHIAALGAQVKAGLP